MKAEKWPWNFHWFFGEGLLSRRSKKSQQFKMSNLFCSSHHEKSILSWNDWGKKCISGMAFFERVPHFRRVALFSTCFSFMALTATWCLATSLCSDFSTLLISRQSPTNTCFDWRQVVGEVSVNVVHILGYILSVRASCQQPSEWRWWSSDPWNLSTTVLTAEVARAFGASIRKALTTDVSQWQPRQPLNGQ